MFDFFRQNIKVLMGLLMLLIIPSFVLFGIQGYDSFRDKADVVAKVAGNDITRREWDAAHRQQVDRLLASMPTVDRALLDNEESRFATLDQMVNERVLAAATEKMHVVTTDQRLARELTQNPTIAALRKPDGSLDMERYREIVGAQGMSPEMFENSVRADLARRQVIKGLEGSGFVTAAVAQPGLQAFFERREIQVARFDPREFLSRVTLTQADIEKYYQDHPEQFRSVEQADIEYLVLDLNAIAKTVKLNEADVRAYYEQNNAKLAKDEQRRASHILLTVASGASAEEKAKVKAQAQALLDEVRKQPARFAELAKTRSQDPGSAANGGDLDFFARGAMVKPFEDVVFSLDKGQISDLVETEFGFHIIRLTDIRQSTPRPFEAVRAELEADLKRQQAQRQFAEAAEMFSNLVYEQAENLEPAAKALQLEIKTQKQVLRNAAPGAEGVLASPKLLAAVFGEDATRTKRNTAAVETGANQLAAARVLDYRPAQVRPLAEVADAVRERLSRQRAAEMATAEGKAKLEAWKAAPDSAKLAAAIEVARNQPAGLPGRIVTAALSADLAAQKPAWTGVDLGDQGYAVVRVNQVLERAAPAPDQAKEELRQLSRVWTQTETRAYLESLKARYKVQILVKRGAEAAS